MIECNTILFAKLEQKVTQVSGLLLGKKNRRYIKTSDTEKEWLKNAKIYKIECCYPGKCAILVEYKSKFYIGLQEEANFLKPFSLLVTSNQDEDGNNLNDNAGLLTYIYSHVDIEVKNLDDIGNDLAENVFGVEGEFDISSIKKYFNTYDFWQIDDCRKFSLSTVYCIYGCYLIELLLQFNNKFVLQIEDETLVRYKLLLESYCGFFIGKNLFNAIKSTKWEQAYFELYRTLENLFQFPYIDSLIDKIPQIANVYKEIYINFEETLDWRPKENMALLKIIEPHSNKLYGIELINQLQKPGSTAPSNQNYAPNLTQNIYKLRNSIAHWRPIFNDSDYDYLNWNKVIFYFCDLIDDIYTNYNLQLNNLWEEMTIKLSATTTTLPNVVLIEEKIATNRIRISVKK